MHNGDFADILGAPLRAVDTSELDHLAAAWAVNLPDDFIWFLSAYGDSKITDFITVFGPRTLGFVGEFFGPGLTDWHGNRKGVPIRPSAGGLVLWGSSLEGDWLCLKEGGGRWTVSVSLRNWFEWRDYDLEFGEWIYQALTGRVGDDWLPEWPGLPHKVVELGRNPLAAEMGPGPAGSSSVLNG